MAGIPGGHEAKVMGPYLHRGPPFTQDSLLQSLRASLHSLETVHLTDLKDPEVAALIQDIRARIQKLEASNGGKP